MYMCNNDYFGSCLGCEELVSDMFKFIEYAKIDEVEVDKDIVFEHFEDQLEQHDDPERLLDEARERSQG